MRANALDGAESFLRQVVLQGKYDRLIALKSDGGVSRPTITAEGERSLGVLMDWLKHSERERLRDIALWPLDNQSATELLAFYSRASLLLETLIERPILSSVIDESVLPPVAITHKLLQSFPSALTSLSDLFPSDINAWRTLLDGFKHCAVFRILRAMQPYQLFETDNAMLDLIEHQLRMIESEVAGIKSQFSAFRDAPRLHKDIALSTYDNEDWQSLAKMNGVQGLLQLHLARILRAQGGIQTMQARRCLARSVQHYEMSIAREAGFFVRAEGDRTDTSRSASDRRRERRSHILASSYRSAVVLCQDAYLAFLESRLTDADSSIKAARLMALVSGDNEVLESEIELVSLCISQSLLKRSAIVGGDGAEVRRRKVILADLRRVLTFNEAYRPTWHQRLWYANMCLYQMAHCRSYAPNRLSNSLRDADRIATLPTEQLDANYPKRAASIALASTFWEASANTLKVTLSTRAARYDGSNSREVLGRAVAYGVTALRALGNRPEFKHLRAECYSRLAEAHSLLGANDEAEKCVLLAGPESTNVGYTTHPFVKALCILISADIAIARGHHQRAIEFISKFEQASLQYVESEWLHEHYTHTKLKLSDASNIFLLTDTALRADYDKLREHRTMTYDALKKQLQAFLFDAAIRSVGPSITDKDLAERLGVNPKTAAQIRETILRSRGQLKERKGRRVRRESGSEVKRPKLELRPESREE